MPIAH